MNIEQNISRKGLDFLIGLEVKANHPITCANPTPTFKIFDVEIENNKLYVRGEETVWFHSGLISKVEK